ncbi:RagB/SusD family nutrient uptake outer membrane protein [Dyadobacter sp. CY323]|uniref:RagB/SusD family nutrient uptake outer membrane protein n=1 Tax=Dyadobacter sp. CY323 TaxID=2907302 RepID=UPI001F1B4436|nr:RagB/SusD family nutrient uptake outer membrane protein [Dyadobacter sp. CY323]MCE6989795.1 RagB/SusD family nutrient uptake outer membrane protein [Dyadobacter sp. CY323]
MNYKKYITILILTVGGIMSCSKDQLNLDPLSEYSEAAVWKDPALAELFANGIYDAMDIPYSKFMQMCFVDEGHRRDNSNVLNFNNSIINPDNVPGWLQGEGHPRLIWGELYAINRKCNILLENVDRLPDNARLIDGKTMKDRLRGEAYFLRAWTYHYLIKLYGGVPVIDKIYSLNDEFSIKRNSFEECVKFIVSDCEKAAELLPVKHTGSNRGRASKGAALALKSRVLLSAASDLYNKFDFAGYTNPENVRYTTGNQKDRWLLAKNAAKAVIDMNVYNLYKASPAASDSVAQNFIDFFLLDSETEEDIFIRYFSARLVPYNNNILNNNNPNGYHGGGNNCPLGDLADSYEMKNGSAFSWQNPAHAASPYVNRDPRFYASILYEGASWRPRTADVVPIEPNGVISIGDKQIWNPQTNAMQLLGGPDGRNGTVSAFEGGYTGYYLRKFMDYRKDGQFQNISQDTPWRHIRFAEILLNYAEACIELGEYDEAKTYLNKIRKRAGMPDIKDTGDALRNRYRNERRVEMAFEDQRMWDVRRWTIAPQAYAPVHGVSILYKMDPQTRITSKVPTITPKQVEKRSWLDKAYFFPIPRTEMDRNKLLLQNPLY